MVALTQRGGALAVRVWLPLAGLALATLLALVDARAQPAVAAEAGPAESQIKAAFICKFGNYVEWPTGRKSADAAFVIGALTGSAGVEELTRAAVGRTVNGRPIVVRQLGPRDAIDDVAILYVARSHPAPLAETLAAARRRPILTITEADDALAVGGIVNFVVVDDRVRFDIALPAAEQGNLKISGRLLALARKVVGAPS
ncbi:MAG TPA: YfiR family protein [Caldimonas sp.]|nr:YfiR family protein [Caldimonas sp.]